MALTGMHTWQPPAHNTDDILETVSWNASIPPGDAFTEVHLANHYEYDDVLSSEIFRGAVVRPGPDEITQIADGARRNDVVARYAGAKALDTSQRYRADTAAGKLIAEPQPPRVRRPVKT